MKAGTGDYVYEAGAHKPEYETMAMFGSNCCNDNLDSLIVASDICNRLGMDTISAGACVAFTTRVLRERHHRHATTPAAWR